MKQQKEADLDGDGKLSIEEMRLYDRKARNRSMMAWFALGSMVFSGLCLMFLVSEDRLPQLKGMLELYWLSLGGIVGSYVGIATWMARK